MSQADLDAQLESYSANKGGTLVETSDGGGKKKKNKAPKEPKAKPTAADLDAAMDAYNASRSGGDDGAAE